MYVVLPPYGAEQNIPRVEYGGAGQTVTGGWYGVEHAQACYLH